MTAIDASGFLLFSGANDRAVVALSRGMVHYKVPFGLIGRGSGDLLKQSRYAHRYLLDRSSEQLVIDDILHAADKARKLYGVHRWVICPTSEYLNLMLFPLRARLESESIGVATCDEALYARVSGKSEFRKYSAGLGVEPPGILETQCGQLPSPPFVAKPRENLSHTGRILYPYIVRDRRELERFRQQADPTEYYIERFVEGESWYLLYYIDREGRVVEGAQQNLLQQGMGKSVLIAHAKPYPEPDVPLRFGEKLRSDGYRGFIMVEVRRTPERSAIAIEANPRCWGPFQLTIDAGMGLFEAFLRDHGHDAPLPDGAFQHARYCWLGGMVQAMRSHMGMARHAGVVSVIGHTLRAVGSDVYARGDSWPCFRTDICKR